MALFYSTSTTHPSSQQSMTPDTTTSTSTPAGSNMSSSLSSIRDIDNALMNSLIMNLQVSLEEIRDSLVSIAKDAGDMMLAADPSVETSDQKRNTSDRVTATDKAVEAMVCSRLSTMYPEFDFLGEETFKDGQKLSDAPTFVCDPIDGTLNFIHGFPNTAVSLALTIARKPVVGVVYNPFRRDLFTAIKGRGAFLQRGDGKPQPLPLKQTPDPIDGLNGCLVAVEWGNERRGPNWDLRTNIAKKFMSAKADGGAMCHSIRSSGSSALDFCYVAAGSVDLYWEGGVWVWDICAGWIIVEEAGGIVASANPGDWEPSLEGRLYLAVRAAPKGQREVVEEVWECMEGERFMFD